MIGGLESSTGADLVFLMKLTSTVHASWMRMGWVGGKVALLGAPHLVLFPFPPAVLVLAFDFKDRNNQKVKGKAVAEL